MSAPLLEAGWAGVMGLGWMTVSLSIIQLRFSYSIPQVQRVVCILQMSTQLSFWVVGSLILTLLLALFMGFTSLPRLQRLP